MITTKKRKVFDLSLFVEELEQSLSVHESVKEDFKLDYVEDTVEKLKVFVKNANLGVKTASLKYLLKHPSVVGNTEMKSFIELCFM